MPSTRYYSVEDTKTGKTYKMPWKIWTEPTEQDVSDYIFREENRDITTDIADFAGSNLWEGPSRAAESFSEWIRDPRRGSQNEFPANPYVRGFIGGAAEGVGDFLSGLTNPVNAGLTLATFGQGAAAKMGMQGTAQFLGGINKLAAGTMAGHGGYRAATADTPEEFASGAGEFALSMLPFMQKPGAAPSTALIGPRRRPPAVSTPQGPPPRVTQIPPQAPGGGGAGMRPALPPAPPMSAPEPLPTLPPSSLIPEERGLPAPGRTFYGGPVGGPVSTNPAEVPTRIFQGGSGPGNTRIYTRGRSTPTVVQPPGMSEVTPPGANQRDLLPQNSPYGAMLRNEPPPPPPFDPFPTEPLGPTSPWPGPQSPPMRPPAPPPIIEPPPPMEPPSPPMENISAPPSGVMEPPPPTIPPPSTSSNWKNSSNKAVHSAAREGDAGARAEAIKRGIDITKPVDFKPPSEARSYGSKAPSTKYRKITLDNVAEEMVAAEPGYKDTINKIIKNVESGAIDRAQAADLLVAEINKNPKLKARFQEVFGKEVLSKSKKVEPPVSVSDPLELEATSLRSDYNNARMNGDIPQTVTFEQFKEAFKKPRRERSLLKDERGALFPDRLKRKEQAAAQDRALARENDPLGVNTQLSRRNFFNRIANKHLTERERFIQRVGPDKEEIVRKLTHKSVMDYFNNPAKGYDIDAVYDEIIRRVNKNNKDFQTITDLVDRGYYGAEDSVPTRDTSGHPLVMDAFNKLVRSALKRLGLRGRDAADDFEEFPELFSDERGAIHPSRPKKPKGGDKLIKDYLQKEDARPPEMDDLELIKKALNRERKAFPKKGLPPPDSFDAGAIPKQPVKEKPKFTHEGFLGAMRKILKDEKGAWQPFSNPTVQKIQLKARHYREVYDDLATSGLTVIKNMGGKELERLILRNRLDADQFSAYLNKQVEQITRKLTKEEFKNYTDIIQSIPGSKPMNQNVKDAIRAWDKLDQHITKLEAQVGARVPTYQKTQYQTVHERSKNIMQAVDFGTKSVKNKNSILYQMTDQLKNPEKAREIIDRYLRGDKKTTEPWANFAEAVTKAEAYMKLSKFIINNTANLAMIPLRGGFRDTGKAALKVLTDYRGAINEIKATGAWEPIRSELIRETSGASKAYGIQFGEEINRGISALVGKSKAQRLFQELLKNPNNKKAKAQLEDLVLEDASSLLQQGKLTDKQLNRAGGRMSEITQGRASTIDLPHYWTNDPAWKLAFLYKRYAFTQTKNVINAARQDPVRNIPVILGLFGLAGEAIGDVNAVIRAAGRTIGKETSGEDADFKEEVKTAISERGEFPNLKSAREWLKDPFNGDKFTKFAGRYISNMSQAWALGYMGDLMSSATSSKSGLATNLMGPVVGDVGETAYNIFGSDRPMRNLTAQGLRAVPLIGLGLSDAYKEITAKRNIGRPGRPRRPSPRIDDEDY